ncbi:MAG: hypothetical protein ACI86H_000270 [bacterium]|jgi:hypothetical protein
MYFGKEFGVSGQSLESTTEQKDGNATQNSEQEEFNEDAFRSPVEILREKFEFPEKFDGEVQSKCFDICKEAGLAYEEGVAQGSKMKESETVLKKFQKRTPGITQDDVLEAKEIFNEARPIYLEKAKYLADNMSYIQALYIVYSDQLLLHEIYNTYLAKLLVSKEARNPAEHYVVQYANREFVTEEKEIRLNEEDERKGKTIPRLREEYIEKLNEATNGLESRYRKRQLMARLSQGEPSSKIIVELEKLVEKDGKDIKTFILLSKLLSERYLTISDHVKRSQTREKALFFCEEAFSSIDTYLNLQGVSIEDLRLRDHIRVGFVKTISAIRNPLIKGSKA